MRLQRLIITGFGSLREKVIELSPGINLLLGPNEAGKSTVLHCLAQVLMGKPSQRSLFSDLTPWDGGAFAAAVEYDENGERFCLTRRFDESGSRAVELHRYNEEGVEELLTREMSEVRNRMAAALGTADDRIFYRVFCLTKEDLNPLENNSGLREHLEKATSGAEVALTGAMKRIDERLLALRRGVDQPALRQNWGALKQAIEARQDWETRLLDARHSATKLAHLREEAQQLQQRIAAGKERLELLDSLLDADRQRRDVQNRLTSLQIAWSNLEVERQRLDRLTTERTRLEAQVAAIPPEYADPAAIRKQLAEVEATSERKASLLADRDRLQTQLAEYGVSADTNALHARLSTLQAPAGKASVIAWVMIGAGLLLAVAAFTLTQNPFTFLLALLGVAVGLPMLLNASRKAKEISALCGELGANDLGEAAIRLDAVEKLRRDLDAVQLSLDGLGSTDSELGDPTEVRKGLAEAETLQREFSAAILALNAITPAEQLAERQDALSLEIATAQAQVKQIPGTPLSAEDALRYGMEQKQLKTELPQLQERERTLGRELAVLEEAERDLIDLEDGVAYWRQAEVRAREEESTLLLARELLAEAGQQAHSTLSDPLIERIVPLFSAMTGGRYPKVGIEGEEKALQIAPLDASGAAISPDQLSRGTRDQFILAVRLALGQVIAGAGTPIFLLDDPLLHFDEDRRQEALAMLTALAENAQIILATHDESILLSLPGANVIRLGEAGVATV
ncbi:MAG: ATP-binding protein [Armatimonadota bacterium]